MYKEILRRCGLVLVAVGALDILYMIWCIANQVSYQSNLNIFAVVGGILLMRGGLKTSRWVISLLTFMLVAAGTALITMPFLFPIGYWYAAVLHGPGLTIGFMVAALLMAVLFWVRKQLLRPEVLEAQAAAGLKAPRIKFPFAVGLILPLGLVVLLGLMVHGSSAHEAIRRASERYGSKYQYAVTSLQTSWNGSHTRMVATVAVYNDSVFKDVRITWEK